MPAFSLRSPGRSGLAGPNSSFGRIAAALLALLVTLWALPAEAAGRKVALVIGNATYANTTSLDNPPNDVRLIAQSARGAGFDVTLVQDQSNAQFQQTLREFRIRADGAEIAMVYYAGHAIEGDGSNWLIPVDARLETEFDLPYEAINLERLRESLTGAKTRMLVLDSCRNNPFGNSWRRGIRAVAQGMTGIEIDDVLIIFAAAPGQVAMDGEGANSPFAASFAQRLGEPGLPVQLLGGAIRDDVLAATGGKQRPFVSASMTGTPIYIVPSQLATATKQQSANDRTALEALAWQGAVASNTVGAYQSFLTQFPDGLFAGMARANIGEIQAARRPNGEPANGMGGGSGYARSAGVNAPLPQAIADTRPDNTAILSVNPDAAAASQSVGTAEPGARLAQVAMLAPETTAQASATETRFAMSAPRAPTGSIAELVQLRETTRLPAMPTTPRFSDVDYPACRNGWETAGDALAKVDAINRCTVALDQYYAGPLMAFRQAMMTHQNTISQLYTDQVGGNPVFTPEDQQDFFRRMREEHAASNPEGDNFRDYRTTEQRYRDDRAFLSAKYCQFAGCDAQGRPTLGK